MKKLLSFLFLFLFSGHSCVFSQESAGPDWSLQEMQEILSALALQDKTMTHLLPNYLEISKNELEIDKYSNKLFIASIRDLEESAAEKKEENHGKMAFIADLSETPEEIHGALSLTETEFDDIFTFVQDRIDHFDQDNVKMDYYRKLRELRDSKNPFLLRWSKIIEVLLNRNKDMGEDEETPSGKTQTLLNQAYIDKSTNAESVKNCPECSWISNKSSMLEKHVDELIAQKDLPKVDMRAARIKIKEEFFTSLTPSLDDYEKSRETLWQFYATLKSNLHKKINDTSGRNNQRKRELLSNHTKLFLSVESRKHILDEAIHLPDQLFKKELKQEKATSQESKPRKTKPTGKKKGKGKGKKRVPRKKNHNKKNKQKPSTIHTKTLEQEESPKKPYTDKCPDGKCGTCAQCKRFIAMHSKKTVIKNNKAAAKQSAQQTKIEIDEVTEDTNIFVLINNPSKNQKIRLYILNRKEELIPERTNYQYHNRVLEAFDGHLVESQRDTADHAFTRIVDNYLFDLGIKSSDPSKKDDERYFNIHLPGEIISSDDQEIKFGVFSYGFYKDQHGVICCYHRCFTQHPKHLFIYDYIKEGYRNVQLASLVGDWQQQTN